MIPLRLILIPILTAPLCAQAFGGLRGPFATFPLVASVSDDSAGATAPNAIVVKPPGDQTNTPGEPGFMGFGPLFTRASVFQSKDFDVDGMSPGVEPLPLDSNSELALVSNSWNAFVYSVTPTTLGDTGSAIRQETGGINGHAAAGDVFSYIVRDSLGFDELHVDVGMKAQDSSHISFASEPGPVNVDMLDVYAAASMNQIPEIQFAVGTGVQACYFTVTSDTSDAIPTQWQHKLDGSGPHPESGANIYVTFWDDVAFAWSGPKVYMTSADFGLQPGDDIDALAVANDDRIILSLTESSPSWVDTHTSALMVWDGVATLKTLVYADGGEVVAKRMGLGNNVGDDMDSICSFDPAIVLPTAPLFQFGIWFLVGQPGTPLLDPYFSFTGTRRRLDTGGPDEFVTNISRSTGAMDAWDGEVTLSYSVTIGETVIQLGNQVWDTGTEDSHEYVIPAPLQLVGTPMKIEVLVTGPENSASPTSIVVRL